MPLDQQQAGLAGGVVALKNFNNSWPFFISTCRSRGIGV